MEINNSSSKGLGWNPELLIWSNYVIKRIIKWKLYRERKELKNGGYQEIFYQSEVLGIEPDLRSEI